MNLVLMMLRSCAPEHKLSVESRTVYCGDHYCTGHRYRYYVCACGEEKSAGEVYDGGRCYGPSQEEWELEHLSQVARELELERQREQARFPDKPGKQVKPGRRARTSPLADE